jgi:hypothetical protein
LALRVESVLAEGWSWLAHAVSLTAKSDDAPTGLNSNRASESDF